MILASVSLAFWLKYKELNFGGGSRGYKPPLLKNRMNTPFWRICAVSCFSVQAPSSTVKHPQSLSVSEEKVNVNHSLTLRYQGNRLTASSIGARSM